MKDQAPKTLEDFKSLVANETALLIYFYNDNCAPCISLRPKILELLKDSFPKLRIVFSNSIAQPEISAYFGAFNNPTLVIFFEGKEYKRESKYVSIPQLKESIQRPYGMLFS